MKISTKSISTFVVVRKEVGLYILFFTNQKKQQ